MRAIWEMLSRRWSPPFYRYVRADVEQGSRRVDDFQGWRICRVEQSRTRDLVGRAEADRRVLSGSQLAFGPQAWRDEDGRSAFIPMVRNVA